GRADQPTGGLRACRSTGGAALMRWDHPVRGRLEPAHFLALAEETGLIVAVGRWALIEASRQTAGWWRALGHGPDDVDWTAPLSVRVNLSRRQFAHPEL